MTRPRAAVPILIAVALLAAAVAQLADRGGSDSDRPLEATVLRAVDGDTIDVRLGDRRERVRYVGVDTPESVKPGTAVQCFAEAAHHFNARLVTGQRVRLVHDAERRDRYGRLLAYVYRDRDGLFVNAELVRRGYALTLTIAPNVRYAARFAALARRARAAGDGLWGACSRGRP